MNLKYNVRISDDVLADLRPYVGYLMYAKKNPQAASNLLDDYDETVTVLETAAGSLRLCESSNMRQRELRIFHGLEDADSKLR